jgi:DNA replication licensing factor MCM5
MADRQTTYSISLFGDLVEKERQDGPSASQVQQSLVDFVMDFHLDSVFVYRDQIRENVLVKQYYCDIDMAHLISYNEELAHRLASDPAAMIPLVRRCRY